MGKAEAIKWSKCRSFMASYAFNRMVKVGQRADGFRELAEKLRKKSMNSYLLEKCFIKGEE